LASGGADGVVKLWRGPAAAANGSHSNRSYAAEELLSFEGHPEEVYALEFVPPPGGDDSSGDSGSSSPWLLTASGQSLFLWDIEAGALVQEAAPPSAVDATPRERFGKGSGEGSGGGDEPGSSSGSSSGNDDEAAQATGSGGGFPPYVFALSLQQQQQAQQASGGGSLVAAACCDGGARLWQLSNGALALVAELKVHDDMGATCAFSPSRPHLLASLSKGGEVAMIDVRRAGSSDSSGAAGAAAVVARHQLPGPVFACSWFAKSGGGSNGSSSDFLAVVGADSAVRIYSGDSLCDGGGGGGGSAQPAELAPAELVQMPPSCGYDGRLLALAVTRDGARLAAGGEPVPSAQLRPLAGRSSGSGGGAASAARRRRGGGQRAGGNALGIADGDGGLFEQLSIGEPAAAQAAAAAAHGEPGHGRDAASAKERAPIYAFFDGDSGV
jgi:WD40 repeat protein